MQLFIVVLSVFGLFEKLEGGGASLSRSSQKGRRLPGSFRVTFGNKLVPPSKLKEQFVPNSAINSDVEIADEPKGESQNMHRRKENDAQTQQPDSKIFDIPKTEYSFGPKFSSGKTNPSSATIYSSPSTNEPKTVPPIVNSTSQSPLKSEVVSAKRYSKPTKRTKNSAHQRIPVPPPIVSAPPPTIPTPPPPPPRKIPTPPPKIPVPPPMPPPSFNTKFKDAKAHMHGILAPPQEPLYKSQFKRPPTTSNIRVPQYSTKSPTVGNGQSKRPSTNNKKGHTKRVPTPYPGGKYFRKQGILDKEPKSSFQSQTIPNRGSEGFQFISDGTNFEVPSKPFVRASKMSQPEKDFFGQPIIHHPNINQDFRQPSIGRGMKAATQDWSTHSNTMDFRKGARKDNLFQGNMKPDDPNQKIGSPNIPAKERMKLLDHIMENGLFDPEKITESIRRLLLMGKVGLVADILNYKGNHGANFCNRAFNGDSRALNLNVSRATPEELDAWRRICNGCSYKHPNLKKACEIMAKGRRG